MKKTLVALFAIIIVACNTNYEKTSSGLAYKLYHGKGTVKPKVGQFVKFNMSYTLMDRDSLLSNTYGKVPAFSPVDTGMRTKYSVMEILPLMAEGDSAEVSISIDTLKSRGIIPDYQPPILMKGQVIKARLQLLKVYNDEKAMMADVQKSMDDEKVAEQKDLENYAAKHSFKTVKTKNGAYVVIENAGGDPKADSGKIATVMYKGYLENGKVFDTNMDSTKGHNQPIQIPVGTRGSIQGFSECLPYFGKGGKGKFLIPSILGYGSQPQGSDIPAYSNLVFDIEVTDVADAPQQPQMPMQRPQMPADSAKTK